MKAQPSVAHVRPYKLIVAACSVYRANLIRIISWDSS